MLRKTTIVLFILFVLAVLFTYALETSPANIARQITPSATLSPQLIKFSSSEIVRIDLNSNEGNAITLEKDQQWTYKDDKQTTVDQGKVEMFLSNIQSLTTISSLNPVSDLDAFGLGKSAKIITLFSETNEQTTLKFGSKTPVESGYYLVVDNNAPVVVSIYGAEDIFALMSKDSLKSTTPTPSLTSEISTQDTASVTSIVPVQISEEPGITVTSIVTDQPKTTMTAITSTALVKTPQTTPSVK